MNDEIRKFTVSYREQATGAGTRLRQLSRIHLVYGVVVLVGAFSIAAMLAYIAVNPNSVPRSPGTARPVEAWKALMQSLAGSSLFLGSAFGLSSLVSAWCMHRVRYRKFSIAVGVLNCLLVPLGTALAVVTFALLFRNSTTKHYETAEDDDLTDELLQSNPSFRKMVAESKVATRKPFAPGVKKQEEQN